MVYPKFVLVNLKFFFNPIEKPLEIFKTLGTHRVKVLKPVHEKPRALAHLLESLVLLSMYSVAGAKISFLRMMGLDIRRPSFTFSDNGLVGSLA